MWSFIDRYIAPAILLVPAAILAFSIAVSLTTGRETDAASVATRSMSMIVFLSTITVLRYIGRRLDTRAQTLRARLAALRLADYSSPGITVRAERGRSLLSGFTHLLSIAYLPTSVSRAVLQVLVIICAFLGVAWTLVFVLIWDIRWPTAVVLMMPLLGVLAFLLLIYELGRRRRDSYELENQ